MGRRARSSSDRAQNGAAHSELSDRTTAPDRHRVARKNVALFDGLITGGKNVGEEEQLFIRDLFGHFERAHIGIWNADVLRLTAGESAEEM